MGNNLNVFCCPATKSNKSTIEIFFIRFPKLSEEIFEQLHKESSVNSRVAALSHRREEILVTACAVQPSWEENS